MVCGIVDVPMNKLERIETLFFVMSNLSINTFDTICPFIHTLSRHAPTRNRDLGIMGHQGITKQGRILSNTFPETNSLHLKKWWLGDDPFLLGPGLFSGAMQVSGRVIAKHQNQLC